MVLFQLPEKSFTGFNRNVFSLDVNYGNILNKPMQFFSIKIFGFKFDCYC